MKSMSSIFYVALVIFLHVSLSRCDVYLTDHADDDDQSQNITSITIDLIHRDSPQSPFHDPTLSPTQRLVNSVRRSLDRTQIYLNQSHSAQAPEVDIIKTSEEYLMYYTIGTPPVLILGLIDTGSDLIWTQCPPCIDCFNQNLTMFRRELSSTYERIPCNNVKCKRTRNTYCLSRINKYCHYLIEYGDKSSSEGQLSKDTFGLASIGSVSAKITNVVFGCGDNNSGSFTGRESGIVGLGRGPNSLISQLGPWARGRFSYCMAPFGDEVKNEKPSKLTFGDSGVVSGEGVVSTPMVLKDPSTFYHVTLLGITVGNQRLEFYESVVNSSSKFVEEGNMIVDSGTTVVFLPKVMYEKMERAVQSQVLLTKINDPKNLFDLCFYTQTKRFSLPFPDITFHFQGADLDLEIYNMFTRTEEHNVCLAVKPAKEGGLAVFGYLAQSNILVGYDLEKKLVSFKPTDCGQLYN